jgi:hypothetical protein
MRSPNSGILGIDIALSISHDPVTGSTYALIIGLSDRQLPMSDQLKILASVTSHPLLLPILICTYFRSCLERHRSTLGSALKAGK